MAGNEILEISPPQPGRLAHGRAEVRYATGLSLLGLTCGLAPVDSLIGGLKPGTIALLTGQGTCLEAAERYCVRAQLPEEKGGLGGGAFFIDGGNSFDVYLFTALARRHHLGYDSALNQQLISRAFTIYELRSLIDDWESVFMTSRSKLLVISEIFSLFEDVDRYEAKRVFRGISSSIYEAGEQQKAPILLTSSARSDLLAPMLEEHCAISADIARSDGLLRSRLFKHPLKAPGETVIEASPVSFNQDTLRVEVKPRG